MEVTLRSTMMDESGRTRLGSENDEDGEEEIEGGKKEPLKRYSSHHQILLVGEGDFSFSLSLASAFGSASNITATSLDPYDAVIRMYKKAKSNLRKLKKLGASLLFGVDAKRMKCNPDLRMRKFDRIIFNFPHAGFHGKEDDQRVINMHKELVFYFFRNASQMLRADGEVHVSHKTGTPYCLWKLEELASRNSLRLVDLTPFERKDYPGYHHKRGHGLRCDEFFRLGSCSTFKFRFYPGAREVLRVSMMQSNAIYPEYWQMPLQFPLFSERLVQPHVGSERIYEDLVRTQEQSLPLSFGFFPSRSHVPLPRNRHIELGMISRNEYGGISAFHQNNMQEIPQRTWYDDVGIYSVTLPRLRLALEQHNADTEPLFQLNVNVERRTSVGDLQRWENSRRFVRSFGMQWLDRTPLLNACYAEESQR